MAAFLGLAASTMHGMRLLGYGRDASGSPNERPGFQAFDLNGLGVVNFTQLGACWACQALAR